MDGKHSTRGSDLRSRRRTQTLFEVNEVALNLFEKKGLSATTVEEIAAAAGISPSTFFRHFSTKEDAALLKYGSFHASVASLDFSAEPAQALRQIEDRYESLLSAMTSADLRAFRSVQELIASEPALRQAADAKNWKSTEKLRERVTESLGSSHALTARLIVETAASTLHAALDQWGSASQAEHPLALFRECRSTLRLIAVN